MKRTAHIAALVAGVLSWTLGNPIALAQNSEVMVSYESISESRNAKQQEFLNRKKALEQQPPSQQRDLQLKQEVQQHQAELKRLSFQEQATRNQVVSDLKQKWTKVDSDWKNECARHDAAQREIEKLPEGPERTAKIEAENASHRTTSKQIAAERNVVHEGVVNQANREVAGGSKNVSNTARQTAGTNITDPNHRGMNGDFDAGGGYRTTEKVEKILNEIGVKSPSGGPVKVKNGVLETSGEFGMTVNADAGLDRIGSAGHQAQVKAAAAHGETYVSETGGAVTSQTLKDHLATMDHAKKAMHGLNESAESLVGGAPEGQAMAKGALKAANQAKLAPETVEAIARQRGIKNPEDILDKLAEIKTGRATITSAEEAAKLQGAARDILNASEAATKAKANAEVQQTQTKIADLEAKGQGAEASKLRQEVSDYNAKAKASSEALTSTEKGIGKGLSEPVKKSGGALQGEPEPGATGGGKLMKGAGLALGAYGIYEGYKTASEEMEARKLGEPKGPREWTSQKAELAARTLWHGLGFGSAAEIGEKAGKESLEQYKNDIVSGKVTRDSLASYGWMKVRAVGNGLFGGVKAITYDAAKNSGTALGNAIGEGVGVGKDSYDWLKNVRSEGQTKEEQSKAVYDKLIKKGASPVGAQRAAAGVLNGDFTEAKRLNRVLEAKHAKSQTDSGKKPAGEKSGKTPPTESELIRAEADRIFNASVADSRSFSNRYKAINAMPIPKDPKKAMKALEARLKQIESIDKERVSTLHKYLAKLEAFEDRCKLQEDIDYIETRADSLRAGLPGESTHKQKRKPAAAGAGTVVNPDGSREVITYESDGKGGTRPVTTYYDKSGKITRKTGYDKQGKPTNLPLR